MLSVISIHTRDHHQIDRVPTETCGNSASSGHQKAPERTHQITAFLIIEQFIFFEFFFIIVYPPVTQRNFNARRVYIMNDIFLVEDVKHRETSLVKAKVYQS